MTMHNSLKLSGGIKSHRNVLTRAERIARLEEKGDFNTESDNPIGLPKVGNRKIVTKKK